MPDTLFRLRVEAAIERLISLLDELDPDPDLETSFGFVAYGHLDECEDDELEENIPGCHEELELDYAEHGEPDADDEPWCVPVSLNQTEARHG